MNDNTPTRFDGNNLVAAPNGHAVRPIDSIRNDLLKMGDQFKMVLPAHITVEKFTRVVMTALQQNPSLLNYDRSSLFASCMACAHDGLLPDQKEAALVPFKGKIKYMPMVGGILKKIHSAPDFDFISTDLVYANDVFTQGVDSKDGAWLRHEPKWFGDRGALCGAYALVKTKSGALYTEIMTASEMDDVRNVSKASDGPWNGPFVGEMWKKTVIRRLAKRIPMGEEAERVIQRDDEMTDFKGPKIESEKTKEINARFGIEPKVELPPPEVKHEEPATLPAEVSNSFGEPPPWFEDEAPPSIVEAKPAPVPKVKPKAAPKPKVAAPAVQALSPSATPMSCGLYEGICPKDCDPKDLQGYYFQLRTTKSSKGVDAETDILITQLGLHLEAK